MASRMSHPAWNEALGRLGTDQRLLGYFALQISPPVSWNGEHECSCCYVSKLVCPPKIFSSVLKEGVDSCPCELEAKRRRRKKSVLKTCHRTEICSYQHIQPFFSLPPHKNQTKSSLKEFSFHLLLNVWMSCFQLARGCLAGSRQYWKMCLACEVTQHAVLYTSTGQTFGLNPSRSMSSLHFHDHSTL